MLKSFTLVGQLESTLSGLIYNYYAKVIMIKSQNKWFAANIIEFISGVPEGREKKIIITTERSEVMEFWTKPKARLENSIMC